jgi:hypothetical protein
VVQVLDDFTLYWLMNTATSAARVYWENGTRSILSATAQKTADIKLPVGITMFPDEIYRTPETWARRAYPNLSKRHTRANLLKLSFVNPTLSTKENTP